MNAGMINSDIVIWRTFATTFIQKVTTRVGADDDDMMWRRTMAVVCGSRQSAVTRLLARPGGALVRILAGQEIFVCPEAQCTVVKVLCYKSEGTCFDSRWCHWNFALT